MSGDPGDPGRPGEREPEVPAGEIEGGFSRRVVAWMAGVAGVSLLAAVWVGSQLGPVRALARFTWPEQVASLGCLLWYLGGVNWLVVVMVSLGILARLMFVFGRIIAMLQCATTRQEPLAP